MSEIAVVVPTFQRAALLRQTLDGLLRQTLNTGRFEVIVTDDGSADGSVDVARSFSGKLNLRYVYHHDLGHRVAATRNAGARAATAPVLVFVDAGTRPSAGCIEAHLRAHKTAERTGSPTVVVGRVAGYGTHMAAGDFASLLMCDTQDIPPHVSDLRDDELDRFSRSLGNILLPWRLAWTANLSVDAKIFHAAGGFDERFTGWGAEDVELAYRLHRDGARFLWSDEAYAIECPQPRDTTANLASNARNQRLFHEMHPDPEVEVFLATRKTGQDVHDSIAEYRAWAATATATATATAAPPSPGTVSSEPPGTVPIQARKAMFGPSVHGQAEIVINPFGAMDGDQRAIKVHQAIGLHTRLPDKCFDTVIVQARHYGPLWGRWADEIVHEAQRIAYDVTIDPGPLAAVL